MKKIGITGQSGFIGYHLWNYLNLKKGEFEMLSFEDDFFYNDKQFNLFVSECDVIVHLAALNRHDDPNQIYKKNVWLVQKLIESIEKLNKKPHIIFASSTQENRENPYGKSKFEGRRLFINWSRRNNATFTGLIIPNVFGPFGVPFYNSVISTFSHLLTHNLEPKIEIDAKLNLIYIFDLVEEIYRIIKKSYNSGEYFVKPKCSMKVSEILEKLIKFKNDYMQNLLIPDLRNRYDLFLFNTFRAYIENSFYPAKLQMHHDERGYLFEIIRSKNMGQTYFSKTKPGITRGNHFHTRKIERFCVVKGQASIKLRKIGTNDILEYKVCGDEPSVVDMPVFYTHNITNIGNSDLFTLFWSNELFNNEDPDTYFETV